MLSILVQVLTFQQTDLATSSLCHVLVQQVRRTEHSLIAVLSQDADLTVEALSNLPSDARGRLQTILALAEETAAQAAGLGTAQYHLLESGEESSGTDDQPDPDVGAAQPSAAWADQLDTLDDFLPFSPGLPLTDLSQPTGPTFADTGAVVAQTTQDPPDDVQQPPQPTQPVQQPMPGTQPPPRPISKAKTKGGVPAKTPPTKAMPTQPQTVATDADSLPQSFRRDCPGPKPEHSLLSQARRQTEVTQPFNFGPGLLLVFCLGFVFCLASGVYSAVFRQYADMAQSRSLPCLPHLRAQYRRAADMYTRRRGPVVSDLSGPRQPTHGLCQKVFRTCVPFASVLHLCQPFCCTCVRALLPAAVGLSWTGGAPLWVLQQAGGLLQGLCPNTAWLEPGLCYSTVEASVCSLAAPLPLSLVADRYRHSQRSQL